MLKKLFWNYSILNIDFCMYLFTLYYRGWDGCVWTLCWFVHQIKLWVLVRRNMGGKNSINNKNVGGTKSKGQLLHIVFFEVKIQENNVHEMSHSNSTLFVTLSDSNINSVMEKDDFRFNCGYMIVWLAIYRYISMHLHNNMYIYIYESGTNSKSIKLFCALEINTIIWFKNRFWRLTRMPWMEIYIRKSLSIL